MADSVLDPVVKTQIDGIKDTESLKKVLYSEAEARIAAEKKADELAKSIAEDKVALKAMKDELAEVKSKNWVEKYSTMASKTPEERLYRFGKMIQAVQQRNPEEAAKLGVTHLSDDQSTAWSGGRDVLMQKSKLGTPLYSDATTGSYLVPAEYSSEVFYVAKQASQMLGKIREIPMKGTTMYLPAQNAAASCSWLTLQSSAKSEVNSTFSQITLSAKTMGIYTGITEELEEDSIVPIAAYFRDIFGEAWGYEIDYQSTRASSDPFTGILASASNVLTMGTGRTSFSNVEFDDLYDLVAELTTVNKRIGAYFIMHCTVFDKIRKIKDANGDYIYQRPEGQQPGTICGYPYIITDAMTSTDAVSTKFIAFGNPKYYLFGNRVGLEFKIFNQTYYAATEDEILFRCRARAGFVVAIAGAFAALATPAS